MNPKLLSCDDQLRSIRQAAEGLMAGLSDAQFNWPPAPGRWSMAYPNCMHAGQRITVQEGPRVVGFLDVEVIHNPVLTVQQPRPARGR